MAGRLGVIGQPNSQNTAQSATTTTKKSGGRLGVIAFDPDARKKQDQAKQLATQQAQQKAASDKAAADAKSPAGILKGFLSGAGNVVGQLSKPVGQGGVNVFANASNFVEKNVVKPVVDDAVTSFKQGQIGGANLKGTSQSIVDNQNKFLDTQVKAGKLSQAEANKRKAANQKLANTNTQSVKAAEKSTGVKQSQDAGAIALVNTGANIAGIADLGPIGKQVFAAATRKKSAELGRDLTQSETADLAAKTKATVKEPTPKPATQATPVQAAPVTKGPAAPTIRGQAIQEAPVPTVKPIAIKSKNGEASIDDLITKSKNSLTNDASGTKDGAVARAKQEIENGTAKPIKVRATPEGDVVIEDGRHRLQAAKELGMDSFPIEDVSNTYKNVNEATTAIKLSEDKVPTLKVFGRDIDMTPENGYKATSTKDGGVVYSKMNRNGRNNKDMSLNMNYYNSNGTKLTKEQASAMIDGRLASGKAKIKENPVKASSFKKELKTAVDAHLYDTKPELFHPKETGRVFGEGGTTDIPSMHVNDVKKYFGSTEDVPSIYKRTGGEEDIDKLAARAGYDDVDQYVSDIRDELDARAQARDATKTLAQLRKDPEVIAQAQKNLDADKARYGSVEPSGPTNKDIKEFVATKGDNVKPIKNKPTLTTDEIDTGIKGNRNVKGDTVSGNALRIEQNAVKNKLTNKFGDLPEYKGINMEDQAQKATSLIERDKQRAIDIIDGKANPPGDLKAQSVHQALEEVATKEGDVGLLQKLANSYVNRELSESAQNLRIAAERDPSSAVENIRQIQEARLKAAKARGGIKQSVVKKEIKQKVVAATPKQTKETWASFVKELQC